jgi:hypothetical protein
VPTARFDRRVKRALMGLAVLVGLIGMHGFATPLPAPTGMVMGMEMPSVAGGHDTPAASGSVGSRDLSGCVSVHNACVAVLRGADQLPAPAYTTRAAPAPAQALSAGQGPSGASRAPPHAASLSELCISRT